MKIILQFNSDDCLRLFNDLNNEELKDLDWDRKQGEWDKEANPYYCPSLNEFKKYLREKNLGDTKCKYHLIRWKRFWASQLDERLFCHNGAIACEDETNPFWDFELNGTRFDLKSTRFPKGHEVPKNKEEKEKLIRDLYEKQSDNKNNIREMVNNRLFLLHLENETRLKYPYKYEKIKDYIKNGFAPIDTKVTPEGYRFKYPVTADILIV